MLLKFLVLSIALFSKTEAQTTTRTTKTTTERVPFNTTLDTKTDVVGSIWQVSTTDYDDWFFYFDNLSENYVQNVSQLTFEYFANESFEFSRLNPVNGVWIAFNSTKVSPIAGQPYPKIEHYNSAGTKTIEIRYYLHNSAELVLSNKVRIDNHGEETDYTWKHYYGSIPSLFSIELFTNATGDFAMIDKIIVRGEEFIPTTTTVRTPIPTTTPTTTTTTTIRTTTELRTTSIPQTTQKSSTTKLPTSTDGNVDEMSTVSSTTENESSTQIHSGATKGTHISFYFNIVFILIFSYKLLYNIMA